MAESSAADLPQLQAPHSLESALPLYDFLYRDANRIASFYAQLFGGRLSSLQEGTSQSQAIERGGGVNLQIASGSAKSSGTITDTSTRVIDPHDLIATERLELLGHTRRGTLDVEQDLRMSVDVAPPCGDLRLHVGDPIDDGHGELRANRR